MDEQNAEPKDGTPGAATRRAAQRLEIVTRRSRVSGLLTQRVPQRDISIMLGVSPATVSSDLKAIRLDWREAAQESIEQHIARELAVLDADERILRTDMAKLREKKSTQPEPEREFNIVLMDARLRVYDRILKVMERRSKLLGLDGPIRLDLARDEARRLAAEFGMPVEEVLAMAEAIARGDV